MTVHVGAEDLFEGLYEILEVTSVKLCVELDPLLSLLLVERILKQLLVDIHHHVGEHGDKATIGVPRKALVARLLNQALHRGVIKTEVKNCIHHARH